MALPAQNEATNTEEPFVESPKAVKRRAMTVFANTPSMPIASGKTRAFHFVADHPKAILAVPHREVDRSVLQAQVDKLGDLERRGFPVVKAHAVQPVGGKFGVLMEYRLGLTPLKEAADAEAHVRAGLLRDELTEWNVDTSDLKFLALGREAWISAGDLPAESPVPDDLLLDAHRLDALGAQLDQGIEDLAAFTASALGGGRGVSGAWDWDTSGVSSELQQMIRETNSAGGDGDAQFAPGGAASNPDRSK